MFGGFDPSDFHKHVTHLTYLTCPLLLNTVDKHFTSSNLEAWTNEMLNILRNMLETVAVIVCEG